MRNPGEAVVSWAPVAGASEYRVGWLAVADYQANIDNERWRERFAYSDVNASSSYTVTRLTLGITYYFITGRKQGDDIAWSQWATLTLNRGALPCLNPTIITGDGASQSSPVPYGQIAEVGDFDVSILSVDPDAWPEEVAENGFNDAPQQGNRMIMFNLHVTNSRGDEDEAEFFRNSDLSLLGSRSMPYTTFGEQSYCGVIPSKLN